MSRKDDLYISGNTIHLLGHQFTASDEDVARLRRLALVIFKRSVNQSLKATPKRKYTKRKQ